MIQAAFIYLLVPWSIDLSPGLRVTILTDRNENV